MNKKDIRREEAEQERIDDLKAEKTKEYLVTFRGSLYVDAIDEEEAICKAQDNPDLFEWVDSWKSE